MLYIAFLYTLYIIFLYNVYYFDLQVPPNGLVIYCGTIVTDEGKEKKEGRRDERRTEIGKSKDAFDLESSAVKGLWMENQFS